MALPVVATLLGAFGIEAAGKVAELADAGLETIFGKRASEVLGEMQARLRAYGGEPPLNHDLERALRVFELTSSLLVLKVYRAWDEAGRFDSRAEPPPPFLVVARDWLHGQLGLCPALKVQDNPALVAAMEASLDEMLRSGTPVDAARSRVRAVEQAVWEALVAGAGCAPPDELRACFFGERGWAVAFRAFVQEAVRGNAKVREAFQASRLAALVDDSAALRPVIASLAGDARAMRALLRGVAEDVRRARENTEALLAGQAALPDAVVEQLLAALDRRGVMQPAAAAGLERETIFRLAHRLQPEEVLDLEQAIAALEKMVEIALAAIVRGERGSNHDALVNQVLAEVERLTKVGDNNCASAAVDDGLAALERQEAARRDDYRQSRAALLEAGIGQDTLRRDAPAVARRIAELARKSGGDVRPAWTPVFRARWDDYYAEGRDRGVLFSLRVAVELAQLRLASAVDADERGDALNLVAVALLTLGQRGDAAALRWAVEAFEEVLQERSRERLPLAWAATQNNLAIALVTLGEYGDEAALHRAIVAYEAALQEHTRERAPLAWAATQSNLGTALAMLGERGDEGSLQRAVLAYEAALQEQTRECAPLAWATTQNNLGNVLAALGKRGDEGSLRRAVLAYEEALQERSRERVPLDWAMTQNNLGTVLAALGERGDEGSLRRAIKAYKAALEEHTHERAPLAWAMSQTNLGIALTTLGERGDAVALRQAVGAHVAALREYTRNRAPFAWAQTTENLAETEATLADNLREPARLQRALSLAEDALAEFMRLGATHNIGTATRLRDRLRARLAGA